MVWILIGAAFVGSLLLIWARRPIEGICFGILVGLVVNFLVLEVCPSAGQALGDKPGYSQAGSPILGPMAKKLCF